MTQFVIPLVVANVTQPASFGPGGLYVIAAAATVFPTSVTLQILLPDGVTFFSTTATLTAAGVSPAVNLPPGKVQAVVVGSPTALVATAFVIPTNLN